MGAQAAVLRQRLGQGGQFGGEERGRAAARRRGRPAARPGLPPAAASRRHRPAGHRAAAWRRPAAISACCWATEAAMSAGRFKCGTSGCRRMVPVALHGASSSTASSGAGGRQVSASACTTVAGRRRRSRLGAQAVDAARVPLHRQDGGAGWRPVAPSCPRVPRTDRPRARPAGRQAGGRAARRRRPAPRTRRSRSRAARSRGYPRSSARCRWEASCRRAERPRRR